MNRLLQIIIAITLIIIILFTFGTGCARITYTDKTGRVLKYTNWKKVNAHYYNPRTGEFFDFTSDPEPWAQIVREAFAAGLEAGKLATVK